MEIKSKDNNQIKYIKNLYQKKYRDETKEFIVEGSKLVKEAIKYSNVSKIFLSSSFDEKDYFTKFASNNNIDLFEVEDNIFNNISDTKTPQGVLAIVKQSQSTDDKLDDILFLLDDIQDPGNLGTIIRTLDSAGYKNLLLSSNTVDVYNPKVVRSTMGAIFRLNFIKINSELTEYLNSLKDRGYKIVVTSLKDSSNIYEFDINNKLIFVMGNEANGVSKSVFDISDYRVKIPMVGESESLNVAVATSIIAYEKVRRNL